MTNRKILFQVAAPAVLIGLLLVGTCLVGAWSIQRLETNLSHILSRNVASLQAALELENILRRLRYHSLLYLTRPTAPGLAQIEEEEQAFQAALDQAQNAAHTPAEYAILDRIARGFAQYRDEMARLRDEVARRGPRTDFQHLADTHPIRFIVDPCQDLGRAANEALERTAAESERVSRQARLTLLLLGVAGPLGGVLCGYGIVRGLHRSIARLQVRVHDVVHRLHAPLPPGPDTPPSGDGLIDVGSLTVASDGDLGAVDRQLAHVVRGVEEVMERLRRQHWDMLRAEQLAAVGQLAAGVAHEVRNPLTGMKLLVEAALRPGALGRLTAEDLHVIHGEIVRLEETVQHFLSFARLPAPQRRVQDLRDLLGPPLDLIRARARRQGVQIEVAVPAQPLPASVDAGQIHQVLVNLLLNALDALPRGGRISVALDEAGGACRLCVRDTGPGIAPEMAGRLFTPFASTKPTGTGLGLSLARRIVLEHGGRITAEDRPEGGACFTITLPREEDFHHRGTEDTEKTKGKDEEAG
jgi:signal transduction histidine kinase